MTVAIRMRAVEALAATIASLIPELEDQICAGPSGPEHKMAFPHLVILPVRYTFQPNQEEHWQDVGSEGAVFRIGAYEGLYQLRLGAKTSRQRAELEEKLSQVFYRTEGHPGVLLIQVADYWGAQVAYEINESEWENELAFDREWYSIITVDVTAPVLVERGGVYTIEEIRLSLAEDMETSFDALPAGAVESVSIDENGTITAL